MFFKRIKVFEYMCNKQVVTKSKGEFRMINFCSVKKDRNIDIQNNIRNLRSNIYYLQKDLYLRVRVTSAGY